ncbi:hypothetical protein ACLOJK_026030 [Asimina triloba]
MGTTSSPRISFSLDLAGAPPPVVVEGHKICDPDFEFLSGGGDAGAGMEAMLTADELFFEGQLLPFRQTQGIQKLEKMTLGTKDDHDHDQDQEGGKAMDGGDHEVGRRRVSWFVDDDPSPRPPKCTVLWKELLRLRKQQPTSTAAAQGSLVGTCGKGEKSEACGGDQKQQHAKRVKKGLERTRSASVRLRPVVHVPICSTQGKSNAFPMLLALKRE